MPKKNTPEDNKPEQRQSEKRRDVLKKAAAVGGVAVVAKAAPGSWTKPVVDSVLLPAHAQTSAPAALGKITGNWVIGDDAPGGLAGIMGTEVQGSDFLYDDSTDFSFQALLDPPAAVMVSADVAINGTNIGGIDAPIAPAMASADSGLANLGSGYSPVNDDWGDTPGTGTVKVTFKAPGYEDDVVTLALA